VTDVDALARELHDVAFSHDMGMIPWENLSAKQRDWFTERAQRMLEDGWAVSEPAVEGEAEPGAALRTVKRHPKTGTISRAAAARAIRQLIAEKEASE
jgi:hypothetical protein